MTAERTETQQLNVELDADLIQRVRLFKANTGRSVRWLVTAALTEFLDRYDRKDERK